MSTSPFDFQDLLQLPSDRIIVMSSRPDRIKRIVPVDLPRPRNEDLPEFIALRRQLRELIDCETDPPLND